MLKTAVLNLDLNLTCERTTRNGCPTLGLTKKWGPCLGTRAPSDAFPFVSVVFTPTRGVIHPSFPLRGRWERTLKCDEQAPSPSLVTFLNSSSETRQRFGDNARAEPTGVSPRRIDKYRVMCELRCGGVRLFVPKRSPQFTLELFRGAPRGMCESSPGRPFRREENGKLWPPS